MPRREELQDEQWALIEPLLRRRRSDGRGRPPWDDRAVRNGILWILRSGARWKDLSARFSSYPTCHRRFQQWVEDGTLSLFSCDSIFENASNQIHISTLGRYAIAMRRQSNQAGIAEMRRRQENDSN